jgi:glycosyltransferase involved in cell wall biosynthesis
MPSISYAVCAHNEHIELERLLNQLNDITRPIDEIVIQLDNTATEEVKQIAKGYKTITFNLNGDFASFKNNLKDNCRCSWVFFIDADEYLSENLTDSLVEILTINEGLVDVIALPRINTVEGLTRDHIDKWRWFVNENGWVNYPDYQTRICANKPEIQWVNKVHERLSSWKTIAHLPEGYDLIHPKTIERQEKQNNYYNTL